MSANCFSFWDEVPQTPYLGFAPGLYWGQIPRAIASHIKIPITASDRSVVHMQRSTSRIFTALAKPVQSQSSRCLDQFSMQLAGDAERQLPAAAAARQVLYVRHIGHRRASAREERCSHAEAPP